MRSSLRPDVRSPRFFSGAWIETLIIGRPLSIARGSPRFFSGAWIETSPAQSRFLSSRVRPASSAGRGLKRKTWAALGARFGSSPRFFSGAWIETCKSSDERFRVACSPRFFSGAWIETMAEALSMPVRAVRPASSAGRGLKLLVRCDARLPQLFAPLLQRGVD